MRHRDPVGARERREVIVERSVLLHDHDDVPDLVDALAAYVPSWSGEMLAHGRMARGVNDRLGSKQDPGRDEDGYPQAERKDS